MAVREGDRAYEVVEYIIDLGACRTATESVRLFFRVLLMTHPISNQPVLSLDRTQADAAPVRRLVQGL